MKRKIENIVESKKNLNRGEQNKTEMRLKRKDEKPDHTRLGKIAVQQQASATKIAIISEESETENERKFVSVHMCCGACL